MSSIDFSDDKLSGEIPKEITSLGGLQFLNLSKNLLIGRIPQHVGAMQSLQSPQYVQNNNWNIKIN